MQKKRLVIIGGSGLLGYKLLQNVNDFEVYATYNNNLIDYKNIETIKVDISNEQESKKIIELKPDIIINTAAMTNVDYCEKFKEKAYNVNVTGVKNIAKIAEQLGSKFVQISSDAVFSGGTGHYSEEDIPNPINIYGKTKLESEKIASKVSDNLILRPSVIFGWIPFEYIKKRGNSVKTMNFALWILNELNNKQKLSIVNDQFSTPTLADNLAENIIEMIKKDVNGVFHASGLSCISRLDFSRKLVKLFGYSNNDISPCSSEELNQIAKRPMQSCLKCEKIIKNGIKLLEVDQAIKIMFEQVKNKQAELIGTYLDEHNNFNL